MTQKRFKTLDSFRPHFDALARIGYLSIMNMKDISRSKRNLHNVYRCVMLVLVGLYNLQHMIKVVVSRHSIALAMDTLFVLLATLQACWKIFTFLLRKERVDRLLAMIDGPIFASTNAQHDVILNENSKAMARLLKVHHIAVTICGACWAIFPFVNLFQGEVVALTAYFPFAVDSSPLLELSIIYLTTLITIQAYGNVTLDCTIVSFYAQGKTQLRILRYNLEHLADSDNGIAKIDTNINSRNNDWHSYKDTAKGEQRKLLMRFVRCLRHYAAISWFITEVGDIFRESLFAQIMETSLVICATLYKIVGLDILSAEFFAMISYLACIMEQLFLYCYYGTQVTYESDMVKLAVYNSDWLKLSPSFRKKLIVMMILCSRPMTPRSASVIPLSLQTYISILKMSYSLFTLLDSRKN